MFVDETTLGVGKAFIWRLLDDGGIEIARPFGRMGIAAPSTYEKADLDRLQALVASYSWTALANNVEKLYHGTEKAGLGSFLLALGKSQTDAQGASQLAAIFVKSGAWEWNGKRKGMEFHANGGDWKDAIQSYYRAGRSKKTTCV